MISGREMLQILKCFSFLLNFFWFIVSVPDVIIIVILISTISPSRNHDAVHVANKASKFLLWSDTTLTDSVDGYSFCHKNTTTY